MSGVERAISDVEFSDLPELSKSDWQVVIDLLNAQAEFAHRRAESHHPKSNAYKELKAKAERLGRMRCRLIDERRAARPNTQRQTVTVTRLADRHESDVRAFADAVEVTVAAGSLPAVLHATASAVPFTVRGRYSIQVAEPHDPHPAGGAT